MEQMEGRLIFCCNVLQGNLQLMYSFVKSQEIVEQGKVEDEVST